MKVMYLLGKLKVELDGQYALMLDVGSLMARRHNLAIGWAYGSRHE